MRRLIAADVDLMNRIVRVQHGKGDKARMVRFDAGAAAALDPYKRARARHRYAGLPWLWIGFRGRITRKGRAMWEHLTTVEDVDVMRLCILVWGIAAEARGVSGWSHTVQKMAMALRHAPSGVEREA